MLSPGSVAHDERFTTGLSWVLVAFASVDALVNVASGALLWGGFATVVSVVALVPAVIRRDSTAIVQPELLALAVIPLFVRSLGLFTQIATYAAVAALALLVVAEIEMFSTAEMTRPFAVVFVVLTTMAVASVWAGAQWLSDAFLGTSFLTTRTALMWDLAVATLVGVGSGLLFELYFRHEADGDDVEDGPIEGDVT
jgi:hypothetical protein